MYSLTDYGAMIADRARMDPYAFAIKGAAHAFPLLLGVFLLGIAIGSVARAYRELAEQRLVRG